MKDLTFKEKYLLFIKENKKHTDYQVVISLMIASFAVLIFSLIRN